MADFYWVAADGSWSDYTNHWSTTSGGTPDTANAPGTADTAYIDINSSTVSPSFALSLDTNADVTNLIVSPPGETIINGSGNIVVSGSLAFLTSGGGNIGNIEFWTGDLQFNGGACFLDATGLNHETYPREYDINVTGGLYLQSNGTTSGNITTGIGGGTITFSNPYTLNCGEVQMGAGFNGGVGTINCSKYAGTSSDIAIVSSGNVIGSAALSSVKMTGSGTLTASGVDTFESTAGSIRVSMSTNFGTASFGGSLAYFNAGCTFGKLSGTSGQTFYFKGGENYTLTTLDIDGVYGANNVIRSQTDGSAYTFTYSPGTGTVNVDYLNIKDCIGYTTVGNEVSWIDGINGRDLRGNLNWTFLYVPTTSPDAPKNFTIKQIRPKMGSIEDSKSKFKIALEARPQALYIFAPNPKMYRVMYESTIPATTHTLYGGMPMGLLLALTYPTTTTYNT